MTTVTLHREDREHLMGLHRALGKKTTLSSLSAAAASFLIIGALIVIGGASLCITIPGVNTLTQVVLPGVLPGSMALVLSIPFVYGAAVNKLAANVKRRELIDHNLALLEYYQVGQMEKEDAETFIVTQLFDARSWTNEYSGQIITDIKERLPDSKEEDNPYKSVIEALDGAQERIQRKKN